MFKNLSVFRFNPAEANIDDTLLEAAAFAPTLPTQPSSIGFVPPRGHANDAFREVYPAKFLLRIMSESRRVPPATLAKAVDDMAASIERETGRKPGRKERRELKDQALLELLPKAFPRQAANWVWIDIVRSLLVIDSASSARTDEIVTLLVKTIPGLQVRPVQTTTSPGAAMTAWLLDADNNIKDPAINVGRSTVLKAADNAKASVRYTAHNLDTHEVRDHIGAGYQPTQLAIDYNGRVSAVLTDRLTLRKVELDNVVFEGAKAGTEAAAEALDADFAIATGEMGPMIDDLLTELGGELEE